MSELTVNREWLGTVFANFAPQMFDFCDCNGTREICDQYSRCTDCVMANLNVLHRPAEEKLQAEITALKDDNSRLRMLLEEFVESKEHLPEWMLEAVEDGDASEPSLMSRVESTLSDVPERSHDKLQAEVDRLKGYLTEIASGTEVSSSSVISAVHKLAAKALAEQEAGGMNSKNRQAFAVEFCNKCSSRGVCPGLDRDCVSLSLALTEAGFDTEGDTNEKKETPE